MANSRIWMECSKCREKYLIFKYYPSDYGYLWPGRVIHWEDLESFMVEHLGECYLPEQSNIMFLREVAPFILTNDN